jgi:5,5'-dehydrodivanillate O-demethylase
MLSPAENERLTRVSKGTPMGDLQRSYWQVVATVADLRERSTFRTRVLGEDLVLFRDKAGQVGLIAERCPHRGVSMFYGIPEQDGIRCPYHGWLFDRRGLCKQQPEELKLVPRCDSVGYPVRELAGFYFAYLGPREPPDFPVLDALVARGRRVIREAVIPCNWLQIVENSLDPAHLEHLHGNYANHVEGQNKYFIRKTRRIEWEAFELGLVRRRVVEGQPEDSCDWTVGQHLIFPNTWRMSFPTRMELHFRTPMDDTHTRFYSYIVFTSAEHDQGQVEVGKSQIWLDDGELNLHTLDGQDAAMWISQGAIADRSEERLVSSDRGIVAYRRLLREQLGELSAGRAPLGVSRQGQDQPVNLPVMRTKYPTLINVDVFHMLPLARFRELQRTGRYESTSFRTSGVTHCSESEDTLLSHANRTHRSSGEDWVGLVLDAQAIGVQFQPQTDGTIGIVIRGPIKLDHVRRAHGLARCADGAFSGLGPVLYPTRNQLTESQVNP